MNTRYKNVTALDSGRFRYPVTFIEEGVAIGSDLVQTPTYTAIRSTRAIREAVTRRFNVFGDITIEAGATIMNNYWYFYIRYSPTFAPLKDMLVQAPDGIYTIVAAPELDEPPNYYKMICVKTDRIITT